MLQYPPPPFMVVIVVHLFRLWFFSIYIFLVRRICSTPYTTRLLPTASATITLFMSLILYQSCDILTNTDILRILTAPHKVQFCNSMHLRLRAAAATMKRP